MQDATVAVATMEAGSTKATAQPAPMLPIGKMLKLPTPSRSGAGSPQHQVADESGAAKAPEPWGLADAIAGPLQQKATGGYRDRLQARGQQAMTRSSTTRRGAPPPPPPANAPLTGPPAAPAAPPPPSAAPAAAVPPPPPSSAAAGNMNSLASICLGEFRGSAGIQAQGNMGVQSQQQQISSWSMPGEASVQSQQHQQVSSWGMSGEVQQWFGTSGLEQASITFGAGQTPTGAQQSPLGFNGLQQPITPVGSQQMQQMGFGSCGGSMTPVGGQQSPMSFNYQGAMMSSFGQQTPTALNCWQQGSITPMGSQHSSMSFGLPDTPVNTPSISGLPEEMLSGMQNGSIWSQDDLMSTLMPQASSMDMEQIAAQLRAAAPCSYDD